MAFDQALEIFDGSNFDALSEPHKVLVTIWGLEADVNNGGFDQYYFNGSSDQAFFAPAALSLIGADQMADIVRRANAAFGADGPPRTRTDRQGRLFQISGQPWDQLDTAFYRYPDDISALLIAYLRQHGYDA